MAFEHKPGSGTVFRETDKAKPAAWTGQGKLPDGTECWINLYPATVRDTGELRKDKNGNPFYNVQLKPKSGAEPARSDPDDDLPF
jgi:hypothetical protein